MQKKTPTRAAKKASTGDHPAATEMEPAAKKRQRLPAEERKKQIIAAAQKVFVRLGMNGTRTRDLAKEAGVNEATLFLYFNNKQEIFDAAIIEPLAALVKKQSAMGERFADAQDDLSRNNIGIEAHKEMLASVAKLKPLLITALFSDQETGSAIYRKDIYPMLQQMTKAASLSFDLDDDEGEFVALASLGLSAIMLIHYDFMGLDINTDKVATQIASLLVRGASKDNHK